MSERTDAPTEGEPSGEPGTFPAPTDPESPDFEPGQDAPDEDGPSDDDATGADTAGDGEPDDATGESEDKPDLSPDTASRIDQASKDLGRAGRAYGRKVATILGDDWLGLIPCPLCADHYPGLLSPAPPTPETVAAVRPLIGLPDFSNYRQDGHARVCDACDGLGKTLTGSRVPAFATITCNECSGTGFRSALDAHRALTHPNGAALPPVATHVDAEPVPAMTMDSITALEEMAARGRAALANL
jgi:hypothetical protein